VISYDMFKCESESIRDLYFPKSHKNWRTSQFCRQSLTTT